MSDEYRESGQHASRDAEAAVSEQGMDGVVDGMRPVEEDERVRALDEKIASVSADHRRRMKRLRAERAALVKAIERDRLRGEIERLRAENERLKAAGSVAPSASEPYGG